MGNVQDAFKYNRARKNVIIGGAVILICITALSCICAGKQGGVSNFKFIAPALERDYTRRRFRLQR